MLYGYLTYPLPRPGYGLSTNRCMIEVDLRGKIGEGLGQKDLIGRRGTQLCNTLKEALLGLFRPPLLSDRLLAKGAGPLHMARIYRSGNFRAVSPTSLSFCFFASRSSEHFGHQLDNPPTQFPQEHIHRSPASLTSTFDPPYSNGRKPSLKTTLFSKA